MLAGNVLLSALAISPYSAADSARSEADSEQEKERSARMANLLGFTVVRTWSLKRFSTIVLRHRKGLRTLMSGVLHEGRVEPQLRRWVPQHLICSFSGCIAGDVNALHQLECSIEEAVLIDSCAVTQCLSA